MSALDAPARLRHYAFGVRRGSRTSRVGASTLIPALVALLISILITPCGLTAQGWILPERPGPNVGAVERIRTEVRVRIAARVAHVEVEEWFENRGRGVAEGVYHYPLPGETVFDRYSLFQGDDELTGETMDADEARRIYEAIVRAQQDPALIELIGQGLVRARVFPFNPGETRRIVLRYTQLLPRAADALEFRYAAGSPDAAVGINVTVEDGERYLHPFSPTHAIRAEREAGRLRIRPDGDVRGRFALFLPEAGGPVRLSLITHRVSSEDGYFMLTLTPGEVAESTTPRDLTVAVDVSGSMSGEKMEQTRRALLQLLNTLSPDDRFRLIQFASSVATFRPGWTAARGPGLEEARRWVEGLRANGATDISGALEEAFRESTPANRLGIVVFLTDGLPTVGERDAEKIADRAEQLGTDARIFAFGVGYDVDTYLLDRLSSAGRGSVHYVEPGEDVEVALGALAMKIRHPVLTNLEIDRLPVTIRDLHPTRLPDLFAGSDLTLFGRYTGAGRGEIAVRGTREGRAARFTAEAVFPEHHAGNDFIPRLWASRQIGELTRAIRIGGPDPELVQAIRDLGLRYGILTEFTSYLVLEPGVTVAGGNPAMVQPMPSVGREAVMASADASRAREARSVDDLRIAATTFEDRLVGAGGGRDRENLRVVAGRAFRLDGDSWVDRLHPEDGRVVRVRAFSPAWFALLDSLPELRHWWTEFDAVVVAGREVSLGVGDDGVEQIPPAELRRIALAFRAD